MTCYALRSPTHLPARNRPCRCACLQCENPLRGEPATAPTSGLPAQHQQSAHPSWKLLSRRSWRVAWGPQNGLLSHAVQEICLFGNTQTRKTEKEKFKPLTLWDATGSDIQNRCSKQNMWWAVAPLSYMSADQKAICRTNTLFFGNIFEAETQPAARKGRRPASHSVAQSAVLLRRVRNLEKRPSCIGALIRCMKVG